MDYHKLNQVVTPVAAARLDVISLLKQMNTSPATWPTAIDLANTVSCRPVQKAHWTQFAFSWQGQQYTFTFLPERSVNSSALHHN